MNLEQSAKEAAKSVLRSWHPDQHDDFDEVLSRRFDLRTRVDDIARAICEVATSWRRKGEVVIGGSLLNRADALEFLAEKMEGADYAETADRARRGAHQLRRAAHDLGLIPLANLRPTSVPVEPVKLDGTLGVQAHDCDGT